MPNAIEWFLGTDPLEFDTAAPYELRSSASGLAFGFQRSADVPMEVAKIQISTDLIGWQDSTETVRLVLDSGPLVTYEIDIVPPAGERKMFVRLLVSDLQEPPAAVAFTFNQPPGSPAAVDSGADNLPSELRSGADFELGFGTQNALELSGDAYLAVPLEEALEFDDENSGAAPFTICTWVKLDAGMELDGDEDRFTIAEKGIWTKPPFFSFGLRGGAFRGIVFSSL